MSYHCGLLACGAGRHVCRQSVASALAKPNGSCQAACKALHVLSRALDACFVAVHPEQGAPLTAVGMRAALTRRTGTASTPSAGAQLRRRRAADVQWVAAACAASTCDPATARACGTCPAVFTRVTAAPRVAE